jgi:dTDP-4-dehydrorhamnose reductase
VHDGRFFEGNVFDAIINCAAYTAVDKAECEPELADTINHRFVSMLAKIAKRSNAKLIHISTDYVFDGTNHRPYVESDPTEPQGVYGKTKCDGEKAIVDVSPKNSIILRTSWVYSSFGNNFVKTMLRLAKEREKSRGDFRSGGDSNLRTRFSPYHFRHFAENRE